jgi:long-chain acyl-CoA synthetase
MSYRNLTELHRLQAERLGPATALRHKRHGLYCDVSWEQYRAAALACAAALADAGVRPGERVGLLSENRIEWLIADLGILAAGAVNVPLHAPLTAPQVRFQLRDADACWLFISRGCQLDKIRQVRHELPSLRGVVVFDSSASAEDAADWRAFLQRGRSAIGRRRGDLVQRELDQGPGTLATIIYTSGTTGNPKGVMLTHGNLLSNALAMLNASPQLAGEILLNWLPFSHIYARTVDHYCRICGGTVLALAESPETVVENLAELRPTHLTGVPRFYEKVLSAVASLDAATTGLRLRGVFGPRIDWLSSGGAPLPLTVAQAYQEAGLLLLQGYGLTESSPVISFNRKDCYKLDTVGRALDGVEIAISPEGEVLTRGPHVMAGYWKDPQATAEALRDGWLCTGDLGVLDADGFLKITGRKKELLVLSNGKKVVPSYLEGLILSEPCIDQVVVCGEGRKYLTALVVPHWLNVRRAIAAEQPSIADLGDAELANHRSVRALLGRCIERALQHSSLHEQVRRFHILERPFSAADDELTVSLKLRRAVISTRYRAQLEALYEE